VQRNALYAWANKCDFQFLVLQDKDIMDKLSVQEVEELFDYDYHTKNIDYIFARCGLND